MTTIYLLLLLLSGAEERTNLIHYNQHIISTGTDTIVVPKTSRHSLIITDTVIAAGQRKMETFSVNGSVPPKEVTLKLNEQAELRFVNRTRDVVYVAFSENQQIGNSTPVIQTLFRGAELVIRPNTATGGVHSYRIYRFEQEGTGASGSVVVEYPR
ncbi:MAG: hypothetical protein ACTHMC_08375 [Pseudobacter sp.]|uniref:hypothetical protein n=1 Tax=Pseudobacter sp. TaxID=2045420 RepID=UPI003F7F344D